MEIFKTFSEDHPAIIATACRTSKSEQALVGNVQDENQGHLRHFQRRSHRHNNHWVSDLDKRTGARRQCIWADNLDESFTSTKATLMRASCWISTQHWIEEVAVNKCTETDTDVKCDMSWFIWPRKVVVNKNKLGGSSL